MCPKAEIEEYFQKRRCHAQKCTPWLSKSVQKQHFHTQNLPRGLEKSTSGKSCNNQRCRRLSGSLWLRQPSMDLRFDLGISFYVNMAQSVCHLGACSTLWGCCSELMLLWWVLTMLTSKLGKAFGGSVFGKIWNPIEIKQLAKWHLWRNGQESWRRRGKSSTEY